MHIYMYIFTYIQVSISMKKQLKIKYASSTAKVVPQNQWMTDAAIFMLQSLCENRMTLKTEVKEEKESWKSWSLK